MELASIYKIVSDDTSDHEINAQIRFNKDHKVFEGHFPGNPIVPGVVQIQILKDLLERELHNKIFFNQVKSIKYLNVINPLLTEEVKFEITYETQAESIFSVKCVVKTETQIFMKFSGKALVS